MTCYTRPRTLTHHSLSWPGLSFWAYSESESDLFVIVSQHTTMKHNEMWPLVLTYHQSEQGAGGGVCVGTVPCSKDLNGNMIKSRRVRNGHESSREHNGCLNINWLIKYYLFTLLHYIYTLCESLRFGKCIVSRWSAHKPKTLCPCMCVCAQKEVMMSWLMWFTNGPRGVIK